MSGPRILLIVGGGIAAYKACELVRLIRKGGGEVSCVLTEGGSHFVTAMTLAALSENPVHTSLWDLKDETEMGHIQLSRWADLIVICPASADLMAKMANGIADDLATTLLLATDTPVMAVPAMNVRMWQHAATVRNVNTLRESGVVVVEPDEGIMACGEYGPGRLPEPEAVLAEMVSVLERHLGPGDFAFAELEDLSSPEIEEPVAAGFAGLSGTLIPRSTESRPLHDFDDEDWAIEDAGFVSMDAAEPVEAHVTINFGGPLLSKKGSARGAPSTDAAAINHLVSPDEDALPPEPMSEPHFEVWPERLTEAPAEWASAPPDPAPAEATEPVAALLDGQPDFDEDPSHRPLYGKHVLITAGPTHEAIDPVRYIANRSSGKQGFAIAAAAAAAGARVTLVSGPVNLPTPPGVDRVDVESARDMAEAVKQALPADVAVMVAAVADWRSAEVSGEKMKKRRSAPPALVLTENPDILATLAGDIRRPALLIGFAAETEDVIRNAREKRKRKGADWIIANDVSGGSGKSVMGSDANTVHIVTESGVESLPVMPKDDVARELVERIVHAL
jgi:phosphopantothenoylcysteine decarboxylase / phosphopantothenate---cysteine ligase